MRIHQHICPCGDRAVRVMGYGGGIVCTQCGLPCNIPASQGATAVAMPFALGKPASGPQRRAACPYDTCMAKCSSVDEHARRMAEQAQARSAAAGAEHGDMPRGGVGKMPVLGASAKMPASMPVHAPIMTLPQQQFYGQQMGQVPRLTCILRLALPVALVARRHPIPPGPLPQNN